MHSSGLVDFAFDRNLQTYFTSCIGNCISALVGLSAQSLYTMTEIRSFFKCKQQSKLYRQDYLQS